MDYRKLGLKVGLEIHQRLATKKLFCGCAAIEGEEPLREVRRRLHASAGELGVVDPAALYEFTRGREFHYVPYTSTCLVELDEEPPHDINAEALRTALQIAKALRCDIPDEIHVMRKTVIDGSNTSGFQRTAIVGIDGTLETSFGPVGITNISLEEESAQILGKEGNIVVYGLDRLGIPLIEIGTTPSARTPAETREVAEALGRLLRGTRVQRGLGTIRQDVNVSIEGGARVEIKGFQELRAIEDLVDKEVERQANLIITAEHLRSRNASVSDVREVTHIFTKTQNATFRRAVLEGKRVYAFILKHFGGLLARQLSGSRTFGRELADYAVAQGTKGMIHSDEQLGEYNLTTEFEKLREELRATRDDVVCVIVGGEEAKKACAAVMERAAYAMKGVPKETRAPNADSTTSYARPLPGGARMYPETDVPPIRVDKKMLSAIRAPESLEEKKNQLIRSGVAPQTAAELADSELYELFQEAEPKDTRRAAEILTSTLTALRRDAVAVDQIRTEDLVKLLREIESIPKEAVEDVLKKLASGTPYAEASKIDRVDVAELERIVEKVIKDNIELVNREGEASFKKLMGPLMAQVRGKISGERAAEALRERLKSVLK